MPCKYVKVAFVKATASGRFYIMLIQQKRVIDYNVGKFLPPVTAEFSNVIVTEIIHFLVFFFMTHTHSLQKEDGY